MIKAAFMDIHLSSNEVSNKCSKSISSKHKGLFTYMITSCTAVSNQRQVNQQKLENYSEAALAQMFQ